MNVFRNFSDQVASGGGLARVIAGGDIALFATTPAGLLISIQTNTVPISAQASHDFVSM